MYDFGQLNTDTEQDYIKQIVHDHVCTYYYCCSVIWRVSGGGGGVTGKGKGKLSSHKIDTFSI